MDQVSASKIAELRALATTKDQYKLEPKPVTDEDLDRFLQYKCSYKKYKTKTWMWVLQNDYDYFKYIVKNVLSKDTRTYKVLSTIIE